MSKHPPATDATPEALVRALARQGSSRTVSVRFYQTLIPKRLMEHPPNPGKLLKELRRQVGSDQLLRPKV